LLLFNPVSYRCRTGFSANKGNRGFGNQLSDGGHRANENTYRVNGMVINDYTNAAPGGATGVNLGVDSIYQFSVLTANQSAEYGRTSGAVIDAVTKTGTNALHGSAYVFDRDSIFDAKNAFDSVTTRIPPFRRLQLGGAVEFPIFKNKTFGFFDYEGVRQSQSESGTNNVPDAAARAAAVPAIRPYLALWPVAPAGSPDTIQSGAIGIQTYTTAIPTKARRTTISRGSIITSTRRTAWMEPFSMTPAHKLKPTCWVTQSIRSSQSANFTPRRRLTSSIPQL
jgi:hypothetical protein